MICFVGARFSPFGRPQFYFRALAMMLTSARIFLQRVVGG